MGGGFGSKLEAGKYTVIAALLARMTGRPVKLFLTREETFLAAGNRPPNTMTVKVGAKKDGTLTAIDVSRARCRRGLSRPVPTSGFLATRPLPLPEREGPRTSVVSSTPGQARAMRAPGFPQGAWALEQVMDALAGEARDGPGRAAAEERPDGEPDARGTSRTPRHGPRECLREGREGVRLEAKAGSARKGDGHPQASAWPLACGATAASPPATVIVKLFADGSVNVNSGAADIGTGTKTVMAHGRGRGARRRRSRRIQIEHADTGTTQFATRAAAARRCRPTCRRCAPRRSRSGTKLLAAGGRGAEAPDRGAAARGSGEVVSAKDPSKKVAVTAVKALDERSRSSSASGPAARTSRGRSSRRSRRTSPRSR